MKSYIEKTTYFHAKIAVCLGQNVIEMEKEECKFLLCALVLHFNLLRDKGIVWAWATSFAVVEAGGALWKPLKKTENGSECK